MTTNAPRLRADEIRATMALRRKLEQRIAELTQLERQAELQLYGIRVALGEMQALLTVHTKGTEEGTP